MATPGQNATNEFVVTVVQFVFHPFFPLIFVTVCGVSFVLEAHLNQPAFGLWAYIAEMAYRSTKGNTWIAVGFWAFVIGAFPLAWIGYREQQLVASATAKQWLAAIITIGGLVWLRQAWPDDGSQSQVWAFGLGLLLGWTALVEAIASTFGIARQVRARRPPKVKVTFQQPHGEAKSRRRANDPDTI